MNPAQNPPPERPLPLQRPLVDVPVLAAQTVEMLRSSHALFALSPEEARCVVGYMRVATYAKDATVMREGDVRNASEMLLLLEGEVAVDAGSDGPSGGVPIAALGPGSVLGEVALLDGQPRSAQCTALSTVRAAALSRQALLTMLDAHPRVAAKLMAALSQRITERLRGMGQHLQAYARLTASLQSEIDRLRNASQRKL